VSDRTQSDAIHAYLVGLYGENPNGLLWIGGHADGWKGRTFATADAATAYAVELDARGGIGVYHRSTTLARKPEKRGTADDTAMVHYFALDVDILGPGHASVRLPANLEDAVRLVNAAGFPPPTYWVHSGGGFYPQWRFTTPIDVRKADVRAWVISAFSAMSAHFLAVAKDEFGWELDNVRDLARVFRLPGTTNRKTEPVTAKVVGGSGETFDLGALAAIAHRGATKARESVPTAAPGSAAAGEPDPFDDVPPGERRFTEKQALEYLARARKKLAETRTGFNAAINNFAMECAHFPWLVDRERCARNVIKALGPVTGWTEPDAADRATINSAYSATEDGRSWVAVRVDAVDTSVRADTGMPRLNITSAADMTYWLAQEIGRARLSGFFLKDARLVHTPRVNEIGYVPGPESGDNGPAEIRPVSAEEAAAKLQFLYSCFKITKEEGEKAAMFPVEAARRVVNAPEAATGLRPLRGITLTPMVRSDGSIFDEPGYDKESGYLFLPGPGVSVPRVNPMPDFQEVCAARDLLLEMVAGFPFAGDDDRANYLGALLTPMLRLVAPPPYKMIGIGAHQPGSGKSLLAETISLIHGGVLRSEVPEDEAEWRKMTTSLLATTSAPVAILDNVTGVLRSSTLAGLLTARGEIQDRELGSSRMIKTENDRLWVVTGNNLSLGGDLVRRTITVLIDPDMANPETRTEFAIQNLAGWVTENRNRLLHALLTLITNWVTQGRPLENRRQSDGYAAWEKVVGGILAAAGVDGAFDAESGKRAATGGDDDGLAALLERAWSVFEGRSWSVNELLAPLPGEMVVENRDWLPSLVLDKLARSEPGGRKSLGRWLLFRRGRWVTGLNGSPCVLRQMEAAGRDSARWFVEKR
jgi:hypothetical protein